MSRSLVALLTIVIFTNAPLAAQAVGAAPSATHCSRGNRIVRTGVGATLGAWLGFVGAKIRLSDWSDDSRSASANRVRNRATIAGALVGAALGSATFRSSSCPTQAVPVRASAPVSQARQPITTEEIQRSGINGNVFELVYSLRRNWLNVRGVETTREAPRAVDLAGGVTVILPGEPQLMVYLDNMRLGTISKLQEVPVAGVISVRYFDGPEATYKWGAGHSHGAIQVLTVLDPAP